MAKGSDNFGLILVAVVALVAVVGLVILFSNDGGEGAVVVQGGVMGANPRAAVVDTGWVRTNPFAAEACPGGYWTNVVNTDPNTGVEYSGGRCCSTDPQCMPPRAGESVPEAGLGYQYGVFDVGREWEKGQAVSREYRSPQEYPYLDPYNYAYE